MYEYIKIVAGFFDICGNEFTTQLIFITLLYLPVFKKRKLFYVRFPLCLAVIIGFQTLKRFGYFPVPDPLNYVIVSAMLTATVFISFKADIMQSLFIGLCIYGAQHIISNLAYAFILFIMYFTGNNEMFKYYYVAMPLILAAGMAATYIFSVRKLKRKDELKFNNVIIFYFAVTFILVASLFTHYARQAVFWSTNGTALLLLIASLFTVSTLLVAFMNISKRRLEIENSILQELLHKDEQRYEQAKLSNEKIQIKYHDMKLRTHQGIVDYESFKEVEADSEILKSSYFTGNRALDVVLSEKAMMCERLGIRFVCTADGATINFMKPHHIYSLIGNALENAIESVKSETEVSLKEITVNIVRREQTCIIKIENYVSRKVEISEGLPLTEKEDRENHGFGAKSMRNVVENYGGQISFYQEGDLFTMLAAIPLK